VNKEFFKPRRAMQYPDKTARREKVSKFFSAKKATVQSKSTILRYFISCSILM
jgi:hypothetical protein